MSPAEQEGKGRVIPAGGGTRVIEAPPETAYMLYELDFLCLREGDRIKKEERWRDICIAVFVTSSAAFLTMLPDLDFSKPIPRKLFIAFVFAVTTAVSLILGIVLHLRAKFSRENSIYARVIKKIESFFEGLQQN